MVQLAPQPGPLQLVRERGASRGHHQFRFDSSVDSSVDSRDDSGADSRDSGVARSRQRAAGQFMQRLKAGRSITPLTLGGFALIVVAIGVAAGSFVGGTSPGSVGSGSKVALSELPLAKDSSAVRATAKPRATAPPAASGRTGVVPSTSPATQQTTLVAVPTSGPIPGPIVVHAAGAVTHPGVYAMASRARAADVVFAAGGLSPDADADRVNLAIPLTDGSRLYIPHKGVPIPLVPPDQVSGGVLAAASDSSGAGGASSATASIDLNTATAEQLDSLPGVGPATAAAIVEHRTKIGRYKSVNQLLDVPGIGEAKLAAMRKRITVG